MTEQTLLHIDASTLRESDGGTVATISVVGNGAGLAERLVALVGQEAILSVPGRKGPYSGVVQGLAVRETKEGLLEVRVKVAGSKALNELVGTDATVVPAQMSLPTAEQAEEASGMGAGFEEI